MELKTLKKLVVLGAVASLVSVAQAAYSTYTEATKATLAQFAQKNYAQSQESAQEALTLAQTRQEKADSLLRLGVVLTKRELFSQAREQFTAVLQMPDASPDDKLKAQVSIAGSYGEEKDWAKSRAAFQKLVDDPATSLNDRGAFLFDIAVLYANEKNQEGARKTLRTLAQDAQYDAESRAAASLALAQSYLGDQDYAPAREALTSVLDLSQNPGIRVTARAQIADTYKAQGDAVQLQRAYRDGQLEAIAQAQVYVNRKDYASARAIQEQTLVGFGPLSDALDQNTRLQVGANLLREGKPAQARTWLQGFLDKSYAPPAMPQAQSARDLTRQAARFYIAKTYLQEGDKTQARQLLLQLLQDKALQPETQKNAQETLQQIG